MEDTVCFSVYSNSLGPAIVLKAPFVVGVMEIKICGVGQRPFDGRMDRFGDKRNGELEISLQKRKMASSHVKR